MQKDFLTQMGRVDVGVDLRGGNRFVSQHRLNGAQVGTTFQQRGGKGMAERVGRHGFLNACFLHKVFNHEEDHDTGERFLSTMADENEILVFEGDGQEIAIHEIEVQFMDGFLGDGHEPLLGALALHLDEFFVKEEIAEFQVDEFADAESAGKEDFDDGFVALSLLLAEVDD